MKIKFLLLGTSLSFIPILSYAQCVETTNCETLGYTETTCNGGKETTCNGGKGVKCPFGNKWACLATEESVCADNGFKYACSGTGYSGGSGDSCGRKYKKCSCKSGYKWDNDSCKKSCSSSYKYTCSGMGYSGGSGSACGGKYTQCSCASGYEWKNGSCQKQILNGPDGDVYKCNGKVVGIKTNDMNFYVAMQDLGTMDWYDARDNCASYSFCGSLKGTLPSKDRLVTMYNNKSSLNSSLSTNGGTKFGEKYYYWSSTFNGYNGHYLVNMSDGSMYNGYGYDGSYYYVRPVLVSY